MAGTGPLYHVVICSMDIKKVGLSRELFNMDQVVHLFAENPVHSEIALHDGGAWGAQHYYTSFMREDFSKNDMTDEHISRADIFEDMALQVTQGEFLRLGELLNEWASKGIRYNYRDLPLAAGLLGHGWILDKLCPDVADEGTPRALFCSQAILLCLRRCLDPSLEGRAELLQALRGANSHAVSPSILKKLLEKHCKRVVRKSIKTESLSFIAAGQ